MPVLFLIVFVDILGFGLLLPLLPFYVQRIGAGPEVITAVLGLYSLAQVIAAPVWGRVAARPYPPEALVERIAALQAALRG